MHEIVDDPVILVGSRRSGTTLLSLMLGHHPEICFLGEVHFVLDFYDPAQGVPNIDEFCDRVEKDRRFKLMWEVPLDRNLQFHELVNEILLARRDRLGEQNKAKIGICVHENIAGAMKLWPNAKYIHLVKDPRDVARSYVSAGWAGNAWYGARPWLQTEREWAEALKSLVHDRFVEVQFEQLLQAPGVELQKICDLLGLENASAMLDYSSDTSYEDIDKDKIFKWKSKGTPLEVGLVEARAGDLVGERGYEYSGYPKPPVGNPLYRAWLALDHQARRLGSEIRFLGMNLALQQFVARRIPIQSWRDSIQQRVDVIINQNLK